MSGGEHGGAQRRTLAEGAARYRAERRPRLPELSDGALRYYAKAPNPVDDDLAQGPDRRGEAAAELARRVAQRGGPQAPGGAA